MATVLLVEDDQDTSEVVGRFLQSAGHTLRTAVSGREALAALLASTPDIVVLDVKLPEMDGVMFLDIIRSYLRWNRLPVVVVTAYPEGTHVDRLNELGVARIFYKGDYLLSDLLRTIDEQAQKEGTGSNAQAAGGGGSAAGLGPMS